MSDEDNRTEESHKEAEPEKELEPEHNEEQQEQHEKEAAAAARPKDDAPAAPASAPKAEKKDTDHINLRVVGQDGTEVFFKIKKHTSLKRLIDAYCERQGVSPTAIRFLFDGRRIQPDQTPKDLGMEDGDIIDAMLFQTGGGDVF